MKVTLEQAPEGSPNFCFGLYTAEGNCITFIQNDWVYSCLAESLGWEMPEFPNETAKNSAALDWLSENAGKEFNYDRPWDAGK